MSLSGEGRTVLAVDWTDLSLKIAIVSKLYYVNAPCTMPRR